MQNHSTDLLEETPEERDARIDSMLTAMVVETGLHCFENDEPLPYFTREQIGNFCGCSKDTIQTDRRRSPAQNQKYFGKIELWRKWKTRFKSTMSNQILML